jgi:hypothetical protein
MKTNFEKSVQRLKRENEVSLNYWIDYSYLNNKSVLDSRDTFLQIVDYFGWCD